METALVIMTATSVIVSVLTLWRVIHIEDMLTQRIENLEKESHGK